MKIFYKTLKNRSEKMKKKLRYRNKDDFYYICTIQNR